MINNQINKIFQIGFNKCGTTSIFELFHKYTDGLKCIHWDFNKLANTIHTNVTNNCSNPLGEYEKYDVITDMESATLDNIILAHRDYFVDLDKAYTNSKFILNIRHIDNWIKSRLNHRKQVKDTYISMYMSVYKLNSIEQVIELWSNDWYHHINNVKTYFSDRPNDLLIFDIETDSFNKLQQFFNTISFNTDKLPHLHKT